MPNPNRRHAVFSWSEIVLLTTPLGGVIAAAAGLASGLGDPGMAFFFGCAVASLYAALVVALVPAETISIFHHALLPSIETIIVLFLFPIKSVGLVAQALVLFSIFLMIHRYLYSGGTANTVVEDRLGVTGECDRTK